MKKYYRKKSRPLIISLNIIKLSFYVGYFVGIFSENS